MLPDNIRFYLYNIQYKCKIYQIKNFLQKSILLILPATKSKKIEIELKKQNAKKRILTMQEDI